MDGSPLSRFIIHSPLIDYLVRTKQYHSMITWSIFLKLVNFMPSICIMNQPQTCSLGSSLYVGWVRDTFVWESFLLPLSTTRTSFTHVSGSARWVHPWGLEMWGCLDSWCILLLWLWIAQSCKKVVNNIFGRYVVNYFLSDMMSIF